MIIGAKDSTNLKKGETSPKGDNLDKIRVYSNSKAEDIESSKYTNKNKNTTNPLSLWCKKDGHWYQALEFEFGGRRHTQEVNDVSWALLNGRSYHTAVSGGKDGVFVWRFTCDGHDEKGHLLWTVKDVRQFPLAETTIPIRVTWNFMATIITVSSSNCSLSIYKKTFDNNWERIRYLSNGQTGDGNAIK